MAILRKKSVAGCLAPVVCLPAPSAQAQGFDPGLFEEVDQATRDLLGFLGTRGDLSGTVLADMLFLFNSGVLLLAGFLVVYHAIAGTIDTAREGRPGIGGWQIMRIVAAVALLAPLPGGMNGAQHIVVGLAGLGGDFANVIWKPFTAEALGRGKPVVPRPAAATWRSGIARTLLSATCRHVANAGAAAAGDDPYIVARLDQGSGRATLHFDGTGRGMPRDLCGKIHFDGLDEDGSRGIAALGHRQALESLYPEIERLAARFGDHYVPGSGSYGQPLPDIDGILTASDLAGSYAAVLDSALQEAVSAERAAFEREVAEAVSKASWLSAAGFFNTIAARAGRFQNSVHNMPDVLLPLPSLSNWSPQAAAAVSGLMASLADSTLYQPVFFAAAAGVTGSLPTASGGSRSLVDSLFEFIDLEAVVIADSGNPVADLTGMGHNLIAASIASVVAISGAAAGSGLLGSVPFIGGGLDAFAAVWRVTDGLVTTVLGTFLVAGIILAYVVPSLPFIRFLFGIFGWVMSIVEAVLAVTVFAAAHVTREDGNRLTVSATRQGWLFLPALVLRPPLMLLGLILAYYVFLAVVGLFNAVWLPRLREINASAGLGVIDALAMLAIYVMVVCVLMNSAFRLIDVLPNAVMTWIGGHAGSSDDDAGRVGIMASGGISRLGALRLVGRFQERSAR